MKNRPAAARPKGRLRRAAVNGLLAIAGTAVALLVGELTVRLFLPQQLVLLRGDIWIPDDGLGWRRAPHLDVTVNTGEGPVRLRTDAAGHRIGDAAPAGEARRRVLAIGDSFLEALQVPYRETLTARLEAALGDALGEAVEVVDAGVGGWGPDQYRLATRRELDAARYDAAVVFLFLGNDVVGTSRPRLPPRTPSLRHALRPPRSLASSELVDALAYPANDALETRSHLFTLLKHRLRFLLMRAGLSAHYLPPVLLRSTAGDACWEVTADICAGLAADAAGRGVPTLFVLLPGIYQVDAEIARRYAGAFGIAPEAVDVDQPARLLTARLAERGLAVLDATPALAAGGGAACFGRVDTHLSAAGHQAVAAAVVPRLVELLRRRPEEA